MLCLVLFTLEACGFDCCELLFTILFVLIAVFAGFLCLWWLLVVSLARYS